MNKISLASQQLVACTAVNIGMAISAGNALQSFAWGTLAFSAGAFVHVTMFLWFFMAKELRVEK